MRRTTPPEWYVELMTKSYHEPCRIHKNRFTDFFCFYCHNVGCCDCTALHPSHPNLQVTDLLEHHTVQLDSISIYIDCSGIEIHEFEGRKLVVLKPKKPDVCTIRVKKPFTFCSVVCKVNYVSKWVEDVSQLFKMRSFMVKLSDINAQYAPNPSPKKRRVGYSKGKSIRKPPPVSAGRAMALAEIGHTDQNTLAKCDADTNHNNHYQLLNFDHNASDSGDATEVDRSKDEPQVRQEQTEEEDQGREVCRGFGIMRVLL